MTQSAPLQGPATDLIPLADQFDNHDEYRPDPTEQLAGTTLALHAAATTVTVAFASVDRLSWTSTAPIDGATSGSETYEAVELRPQVLLLVVARLTTRASALVILDLTGARGVLNLTRLLGDGDGDGDLREDTQLVPFAIGSPDTEPFPRTDELVGKRVHHRYSSTHAFEHIYLNPTTYAYQGLEGPERGVADVDRTDTLKLADELYLFSWHERAQPFNGAIALDLREGRAFGRLFGWDRHLGEALQIRTGSVATLLNTTTYEGL